jgi:hypothetical protein
MMHDIGRNVKIFGKDVLPGSEEGNAGTEA